MEPIVIRFLPTPKDYALSAFIVTLRTGLVLYILFTLVIVATCEFSVNTTRPLLDNASPVDSMSQLACAIAPPMLAIAVLGGTLFGIPLQLAWRIRRQPRLLTATTYEFGEDNIVVRDAHSELKHDWGDYHKIIATKNYYLLQLTVNKRVVRFIPRRAFESPEQENAFRDLLAHKLNFKG